MLILGMLPKMAAFVESIPAFVLGGAGVQLNLFFNGAKADTAVAVEAAKAAEAH